MKKFFTTLAIISAIAFTMSACTEEEVKPATETSKQGGGVSDKGF